MKLVESNDIHVEPHLFICFKVDSLIVKRRRTALEPAPQFVLFEIYVKKKGGFAHFAQKVVKAMGPSFVANFGSNVIQVIKGNKVLNIGVLVLFL